jgi:hypothetical protein
VGFSGRGRWRGGGGCGGPRGGRKSASFRPSAKKIGQKRAFGHENGTNSVRECIDASIKLGVKNLTLYVFSTENWNRPKLEVNALMDLLVHSLEKEKDSLIKNNIKVNVTLIFSVAQALLASKAGAAYVSPFVGRVDDNSFGGLCLVKDISDVYTKHILTTQVLAASLRNVRDAAKAFQYGANIVTMPPKVFGGMYNHILTDAGLKQFDIDYAESIAE